MQVGQGDLPLSSNSFVSQGSDKGEIGEDRSNIGLPSLAKFSLVASSSRNDDEASLAASPLQAFNHSDGKRSNAIFGALSGSTYFCSQLRQRNEYEDLDEDDEKFLFHHLASQTSTGYGYIWRKFSKFCAQLNVNPFSCSPAIIVRYLRQNFENGAQYRSINFIRSAISKFHKGFDSSSAGEHLLVKQACKAAFRLRPPLPKYQTTFDMKPVLQYVATILGNNNLLTLKWLTFKTAFLIAFSSLSRVSTLSRLGSAVSDYPEHIIIPILTLEKQARGIEYGFIQILSNMLFSVEKPDKVRGWLQLASFPEDERICPVKTLQFYLAKVMYNFKTIGDFND